VAQLAFPPRTLTLSPLRGEGTRRPNNGQPVSVEQHGKVLVEVLQIWQPYGLAEKRSWNLCASFNMLRLLNMMYAGVPAGTNC
jgi:hypothetical protein